MKNSNFLILGCFLLLMLATDAFQNENSPGEAACVKIKALVGGVQVRNTDSKQWRRARVGMKLAAGCEIKTERESTVELMLERGGVINIGENSIITISDLLFTDTEDGNTNKVDNK